MASAPTIPLVPLGEYLESSYEHDMEYVDGVLVERAMPTVPRGVLQMLVGAFLLQFASNSGLSSRGKFAWRRLPIDAFEFRM